MKSALYLFCLVCLIGCSTFNPKPEELKAAPMCKVWTNNALGMNVVADIKEHEEKARQQVACWVLNTFICTYNTYSYASTESGDINSSISGKVGNLNGKKMKFKMTGSESDEIFIDKGAVDYAMTGAVGPKRRKHIEYNDKCTDRQVAVGLLALAGQ